VRLYKGEDHKEYWGEQKYSGRGGRENFPGLKGIPPLEIPGNSFVLHFHSDGSSNDWGYELIVKGRTKRDAEHLSELCGELLNAYPEAAKVADAKGCLPLHSAIKSNAPLLFTRSLLNAYPEAAKVADAKGCLPLHSAINSGAPLAFVKLFITAVPNKNLIRSNIFNL
jgi:hypothetical protein